MIANDPFERLVSDWLHSDAEHRVPDHLEAVLRLTGSARQRPAWSSLERWLPMETTFTGRLAPAMRPAFPLIVLLLLIAMMAAFLVIVGSRQPQLPAPFGPADNGSILFSARGDILIADPDGSDPRALIGGPEDDVAPVVSSDGVRFVFFRKEFEGGYTLHVSDIDGTDVALLTEAPLRDPSWAEWSPDGSSVLVVHKIGAVDVASTLATDGSGSMRQLDLGDIVPDSPTWRPPDGREIVLRGESFDGVALYAVGADDGALRQITPIESSRGARCLDGCYLRPRLSPDGTRVTFWHNMAADLAAFPEGRKSEVHVLDLRTGADIRIGYDPTSRHELLPKFSPDGKSVLFVRFPVDGDATVLTAAADGSDGAGRQLGPDFDWAVTGALNDPTFEYSPDGRKILLSFGADRRLQILDVATGTIESGDYADFIFWQRTATSRLGDVTPAAGATPCPGGGCR
jgi:Tol biopolymer transport system component